MSTTTAAAAAPTAGVERDEALRLHRLMMGYLSSKALFSALRFGIFDVLAAGEATPEAVAAKVGLPERSARVLLLAMEGEGLVGRNGSAYYNEPVAAAYLVSSSPDYMGALASHQEMHFAKLTRLDEALQSDGPVQLGEQHTGEFKPGPQVWARRWTEVFRASSRLMAEDLASKVDLGGRRHLVDLGAAACSYSIALARANPDLVVTAVDLPAVADVGREFVAEAGLSDRIDVRGADIFTDRFPDSDVALLSHVIQGFGRERARALLAHIYDWLPAGGLLVVHSHFPEPARLPFPYQFGLIMMINSPQGGEAHGQALTEEWLREIGFTGIGVAEVSPISALLTATK